MARLTQISHRISILWNDASSTAYQLSQMSSPFGGKVEGTPEWGAHLLQFVVTRQELQRLTNERFSAVYEKLETYYVEYLIQRSEMYEAKLRETLVRLLDEMCGVPAQAFANLPTMLRGVSTLGIPIATRFELYGEVLHAIIGLENEKPGFG